MIKVAPPPCRGAGRDDFTESIASQALQVSERPTWPHWGWSDVYRACGCDPDYEDCSDVPGEDAI